MDSSSWWTLKICFGGTAALFGLSAALFAVFEAVRQDDQAAIRKWFEKTWKAVKESRWVSLPEDIIRWLVSLKRLLSEKAVGKLIGEQGKPEEEWKFRLVCGSVPFLSAVGAYLTWGIIPATAAFVVVLPVGLLFWWDLIGDLVEEILPDFVFVCYLTISFGGTTVLITYQVLSINILVASLLMLLCLPLYWLYMVLPVAVFASEYSDYDPDNLLPVSLATALSFTVTLVSMLLGHLAQPDAWIPQTLQMLVSNVVFDGLTFLATMLLLSWAVARHTFLRIPFVIVLDVSIAAVFACASLYFGLVFTQQALSLREVVNVLLGRSPSGANIEIGPLFWTMHTAFLPTLVYLALLLMAWLAKALLIPVEWFFGAGQANKNPLKLTVALLTFVSVLFGTLCYMANAAEEHADRRMKSKADPDVNHSPTHSSAP